MVQPAHRAQLVRLADQVTVEPEVVLDQRDTRELKEQSEIVERQE
jgi:hypothetical protein